MSADGCAPSGREWSPMQAAIFAFVEGGEGHGVVEALAGTGKSTTIEEAVRRADPAKSVLVCAFNKSIAEALKLRMPSDVDVATLHSLGLKAVTRAHGRREVDGRIPWRLAAERLGNFSERKAARAACVRLVSLAKGTLTFGIDDLDALADSSGLEIDRHVRRDVLRATEWMLELGARATEGPIDFDDMIWLPHVQQLRVPRYELVFVDETQDLNAAQLDMIRKSAGDDGRIIAVGDRRQAIYGFRGADSQAIPRMVAELRATVLPLSITYRCPRAVVQEANALVPQLQAAPGAPQGIVRSCEEPELREGAAAGDMVLSRTNAPLVSLAFGWLGQGRRCRIQGRAISEGIINWIEASRARSVTDLLHRLHVWEGDEIARLLKEDRPTDTVQDKADCIRALAEGKLDVRDVIAAASELFEDDGAPGILLSSTHRAKGLEADRVWLLRDTYLQRPGEEERNLLYVAITRAKRELIYVLGNESEQGEPE